MTSVFRIYRILLILAVGTTVSAAEVHLRPQANCQSNIATLGDVADVTGAMPEEQASLAGVELFPAPVSGQTRLVKAREVVDALARNGVNLRQVKIGGASAVKLTGPSHVVPASATSQIEPKRFVTADEFSGEEQTSHEVVVAVRSLKKGDLLRAGDVAIQLTSGLAPADQAALSIDDVLGKETTRTFAPGQAISLPHVRSPLLVRRNEVVTVKARASGLQVRTTARALEDGSIGDVITLQSLLDGRERFMARVVAHKEAEIFAGRPSLSSTSPKVETKATAEATPPKGWQRPSPFALRVGGAETPR